MSPHEDNDCIHGLDPEWCATCKHGPAIKEPLVPAAFALLARYDGHCPTCNLPIHRGERIRRWSDDVYRHITCTPEGARP